MVPDAVAAKLLPHVFSNKFMIIPGIKGKFSYYAKRLIPVVVEWVMDRVVRRTQIAIKWLSK